MALENWCGTVVSFDLQGRSAVQRFAILVVAQRGLEEKNSGAGLAARGGFATVRFQNRQYAKNN